MKKINITVLLSIILSLILFSSCDDFLNEVPKGQKIPKTWDDFNNFIRNEYADFHRSEMGQVYVLLNDVYRSPNQQQNRLVQANYNWDETIDRVDENTSDYYLYVNNYSGIFYANLLLDMVPDATDATEQQKKMLMAQARVLRAMSYFQAANYHADQYHSSTLDKLSIPLVKSSGVEAASPQVTIKELYDFMEQDLLKSIDDLPERGETIHHSNKATGYGMLARLYLSMSNYTEALKYAELALKENDSLFDWIEYYEDDKERFAEPSSDYSAKEYNSNPKPMAKTNPENYLFRYGSNLDHRGISGKNMGISMDRAARFEEGDARLRTHWKRRYYSNTNEELYFGIHGERMNVGGISSPEMYYIKAECLARKGGQDNINAAMDVLNKVREKRIFPENYEPAVATSTKEAVEKIISEKANEYIQTMIPFWDLRRLNKDPEYARTLTKQVDGETVSLKPDSHLWIMPFANTVLGNPGNNELEQNTPK